MIVSIRRFTYDELVGQLSKDDKIVLFTCGSCIKFCDIGGRERQSHLAEKLKADGYNVTREELTGVACMLDLVELRGTDDATAKTFAEATVVIPLTCEDGYDVIDHAFPHAKVISVTKTVGLGVFSTDRGMTLTVPFENTGLKMNIDGYPLSEVAKKLGYHAGPYYDGYEKA